MIQSMKDWSIEFKEHSNSIITTISDDWRDASNVILEMPKSVNREVLESHMFRIKANVTKLSDHHNAELLKFKDEKVDAWGKQLAKGLLWQAFVSRFFAFEMMRRQDVVMSELTYKEDEIPEMRQRTKVPDLTYTRLQFPPKNEFVDRAL